MIKRVEWGAENGHTESFSEIRHEILVCLLCLYTADVT